MTKAENIQAGRAAGTRQAESMTEGYIRTVQDADTARRDAETACGVEAHNIANRSAAFHDAYIDAYMTVYYKRRSELPEVKAENRKRSIDWVIDGMRRANSDVLATFEKNFKANPLSAFEWSDGAIQAAAKDDVATRLRAIIDHPEGGYEAAVAHATEQALRGARWPEHSTSQVSNVAKTYVTAAYAEFAASFAVKA